MRYTMFAFVMLLLVGCQSERARNMAHLAASRARLDEGIMATVLPNPGAPEPFPLDSICCERRDRTSVDVPLGTRVLVLSDKAHDAKEEMLRPVLVNIKDGPHAGEVVLVTRAFLRPVD